MPIVFFPAWLETLCRILPFAWMLQVPIEVWLGQHQGIELLQVYAVQVAVAPRPRRDRARSCSAAPSDGWWCRVAEAVVQLRVWRRLVGAKIRSGWQYRGSFWLFLLSQTLVMCLDFGVILAIFTKVDTLGGWSATEVALLYGLSGVAFGIADTIVSAVENATTHIKAGTFDLFLLRPVSPLLHLTASEFELRRIGRVIQPVVVLVGAVVLLDTDWTRGAVALVPAHRRGRHRDLQRGVDRHVGGRVLDGREPGDGQRLHLRRQPRHPVPARRAGRLVPSTSSPS